MQFETIATGLYLEALLIDGDDVWYSDVAAGGVFRIGADGQRRRWLAERRWIGGLLMNDDGRLLVSGADGIVWLDPATGDSGVVIDSVAGDPLIGVNEMRPDGAGGLYFGTVDIPAIIRGQRPAPAVLCRLDPDLSTTILAPDLTFTNGLSPSADGSRLYHNESFVGTFAYPILADGGLGTRTKLVEKADCDGMALDSHDRLWLSGFSSGELLCVDPGGTIVERVPIPGPAATNIRFGGPDLRDLYVTVIEPETAAGLARGELPTVPTSRLCRAHCDVPGSEIERTRLQLAG